MCLALPQELLENVPHVQMVFGIWNFFLVYLSGNLFIILKTNKQIKKRLSETVIFEMDIFQPDGEIY